MRRMIFAALMVAGTLGVANAQTWGTPAAKQAIPAAKDAVPTVKDIDALQAVVTDAWAKMPLTQRRAIFVAEAPDVYGNYKERSGNVFKAGEKLVTYVEPIGYGWKPEGDAYTFGFVVDFLVKSPDGKILAGQEGFAKFSKTSRTKIQEFMVTLTLSMDGAPAGKYVLEYTMHDIASAKTSSFQQPFVIGE